VSRKYQTPFLSLLFALSVALPVFAQETPPVEPTPLSATAEPLDLPITYTSLNRTVTFSYPSGWILKENSDPSAYLDASVANSKSASGKELGSQSATFAPGEVKVQLLVIDQNSLLSSSAGLTTTSTPIDILKALQTSASIPDGMTMSVVTATSVNDRPGAQFQFNIDRKGEGRLVLIRYRPGLLALMAVFAAPGELPQWDATARAIFESLAVSQIVATPTPATFPPTPTSFLSETATSPDNHVTVSYPAGWVTRPFGESGIYFANSNAALNRVLGDAFESGDVQIVIAVDTVANLIPEVNVTLEPEASPAKFLQAIIKSLHSMMTFDQTETITVRENLALTVTGRGSGFEGRGTLIEFSGSRLVGLARVLTAPGELSRWEAVAQAMMESIVFS
jgi:hypothetical protein